MGNYTIFGVFENPRRDGQAINFTTNVPKNSRQLSRSQIVSRTDIFQKLTLAAPVYILHEKFLQFDWLRAEVFHVYFSLI